MLTDDLDFNLPPQRIATAPAEPRDSARLMIVYRDGRPVEHAHVCDLARRTDLLGEHDLLVFNQSRVVPARFTAVRTATGGQVGGLYLESPEPDIWLVMLESRGSLQPGERITLDAQSTLELLATLGDGRWRARLHAPIDTLKLLERIGSTPLPPYIRQRRRALGMPEVTRDDAMRYNTIYAKDPGSVAAPTAGLHFTPALLDALQRRGVQRASVTLHVGLGTFAPVRTEQLEDHAMHHEWMSVPQTTLAAIRATQANHGRIIPVGTTSVRTLESLPQSLPAADYTCSTNLFILPGRHTFRFADALLTNFHLPRSTLLAMVAALPGVGVGRLLAWYRLAVEQGYRFYSYGDAMLII